MANFEQVFYTDTMKTFVDKYNANLELMESFSTVVPRSRLQVTPDSGVITVSGGYHRGINDMEVFLNGLLLDPGVDYIESTDSTVTLLREVSTTDKVTIIYTPRSLAPTYGSKPELFGGGVIDSLQSTSTDEALSASQGKILNDRISANVNILTQEILQLQQANTQLQGTMDNLEDVFDSLVISAGDSNSEVVESRISSVTGVHQKLKSRLDKTDEIVEDLNLCCIRLGDPIEDDQFITTDLMEEISALRGEVAFLKEYCVLSYPRTYEVVDIPDEEIKAELSRMQTIYQQTVFPEEVDVDKPYNQYSKIALRDFNQTTLLVTSSTDLVLDSSGETQFNINRYYNEQINSILNRIESIVVRLNALESGN